jgi:glycosyltransferase involved in cell wall biosynthesis
MAMPERQPEHKPLKGIKVALTAIDLEQQEHRGIAFFTRNLAQTLHELGCDVYLITALRSYRVSAKQLSKMCHSSAHSAQLADIIHQLSQPKQQPGLKAQSLIAKARTVVWASKLLLLFWFRRGLAKVSQELTLTHTDLTPYQGLDRLQVLAWASGFLQSPAIYALASLRSRGWLSKPPKLDLRRRGVQLLITSCPLSLEAISDRGEPIPSLQVIHDCFALEVAQHPDHPWQLYNRLADALNHHCLFVSEQTRRQTLALLQKYPDPGRQSIIHQPPSLSENHLNAALLLPELRGLRSPFLLFNASVVPRKNLLFLIQLFRASSLNKAGVRLVIAGKIHPDPYGQSIHECCRGDSSIELWGYVNELEKAWLFLRALALASPSGMEGFGIPVLDGGCLGLPVLASAIPSHAEIAALLGHPPNLKLLPLNDNLAWVAALQGLTAPALVPTETMLQERLRAYHHAQSRLRQTFAEQLAAALQAALGRGTTGPVLPHSGPDQRQIPA